MPAERGEPDSGSRSPLTTKTPHRDYQPRPSFYGRAFFLYSPADYAATTRLAFEIRPTSHESEELNVAFRSVLESDPI